MEIISGYFAEQSEDEVEILEREVIADEYPELNRLVEGISALIGEPNELFRPQQCFSLISRMRLIFDILERREVLQQVLSADDDISNGHYYLVCNLRRLEMLSLLRELRTVCAANRRTTARAIFSKLLQLKENIEEENHENEIEQRFVNDSVFIEEICQLFLKCVNGPNDPVFIHRARAVDELLKTAIKTVESQVLEGGNVSENLIREFRRHILRIYKVLPKPSSERPKI
jgi:hypothetical protein